jgi:hypothetical protein
LIAGKICLYLLIFFPPRCRGRTQGLSHTRPALTTEPTRLPLNNPHCPGDPPISIERKSLRLPGREEEGHKSSGSSHLDGVLGSYVELLARRPSGYSCLQTESLKRGLRSQGWQCPPVIPKFKK